MYKVLWYCHYRNIKILFNLSAFHWAVIYQYHIIQTNIRPCQGFNILNLIFPVYPPPDMNVITNRVTSSNYNIFFIIFNKSVINTAHINKEDSLKIKKVVQDNSCLSNFIRSDRLPTTPLTGYYHNPK